MQSQHRVYKAGSLQFTQVNLSSFTAVLVVFSSYNTFVKGLITLCLERQCAVVSKQLAVPPSSLNFKLEAHTSATTLEQVNKVPRQHRHAVGHC